jgi:hypothetical protein
VYHREHNRDQQNYIAGGNHVTAYSWKQYIEINLKLVECLFKFQWEVGGVAVHITILPLEEALRLHSKDIVKVIV